MGGTGASAVEEGGGGSSCVRPGVVAKEDVGVLVALEEYLERADFGGEGLAAAVECASIPVVIVESFGGEVDDVGVGYHKGFEAAVEETSGSFRDVGEIGDQAE